MRGSKSRIVDMTTGSTVKHIAKFSVPLLIGNLFQQLYNMVDSVVVGNYVGANALAAVGSCGSINFLFFALSAGLATGVGIIISQYFGAKDDKNIRKTIANAVYVLAAMSILVMLIGMTFSTDILRLLKTPAAVLPDASRYLRVTCAGIVGVAFYNGVASILRSLGDSRTPLYFLIFSSIINISLDLLFVLQFGWGVFGVAVATIVAQWLSAIISIIYAYIKVPYFRFEAADFKPNKKIIVSSYSLGMPVSLQNSMIAVSCMALQGVVNSFGPTVMAAYTVTNRIEMIIQQPYGSLGMALTTYSGQNMGAAKIDRVKKGYKQATLIVLVFSILMIPAMFLFGETIVRFFVKDNTVINMGAKALRITSLCYFGLGMIYVPRAVLNGCGDTKFALVNGISEVACRIGFSQILTRIPVLGCWAVWLTTGATWVFTAIVCVLRYVKGNWEDKSIVKKKPVESGDVVVKRGNNRGVMEN